MAPLNQALGDRRSEQRVCPRTLHWRPDAVLRPGLSVVVVNINSQAALVESEARLRPGAHTELQVNDNGQRTFIKGRLGRCQVATLEPLRYRGVLVFDQRIPAIGCAIERVSGKQVRV